VNLRRLPSLALIALAACAGKVSSGAVTSPLATPAAPVDGKVPALPPPAGITRVINDNRADIKGCYQHALLEDHRLTHGRITVRVAIETSGQVKRVEIEGPPEFQSLEPCIMDRVGLWSFPQALQEYGTQFVCVFQGNVYQGNE